MLVFKKHFKLIFKWRIEANGYTNEWKEDFNFLLKTHLLPFLVTVLVEILFKKIELP